MINASTYEKLKALNCSAMADEFQSQINDSKSYALLGFEERLGLLVDAEWNRRQANKLKNLIKRAAFSVSSACIEDIEYLPDRKIDKAQMLRFSTCQYINEGHHIILKGATGSGKTYIACALGNAACRKFKTVRYIRMPELLDELSLSKQDGTYRKVINYVLDKSVLTIEEKKKIMESLNALNEVSVSADNDSISKLRSFLGEQYQDWIEIEFSGWENRLEDGVVFEQIKNAIMEHSYMEITYSGSRESLVKRKIKPIKMCFKDQAWYLYAYCCLREDYRFFKLKRMSQITVLDKHFEPENVGKILPEVSRKYSERWKSVSVTIEISQEMAFRAYEELRNMEVTDQGNLLCNVQVADINWFISYVLSYGSYIRVLEPLEIKEKVMQEIKKMNDLYGGNDGI